MMDTRLPPTDSLDADDPPRSRLPRCPACGAVIAADALWCSLCLFDLRPQDRRSDAPQPSSGAPGEADQSRDAGQSAVQAAVKSAGQSGGLEPGGLEPGGLTSQGDGEACPSACDQEGVVGRQLLLDLDLPPEALPADPEDAARALLAELAVTEHGQRLPAQLAFLATWDSPGQRTALACAGIALLTALGLVCLWLVGSVF